MRLTLNYCEQTDETLVALTLLRDEGAFEELVKRHQRAALLIAQSVTKNLYTAEDAVQDAFLTAWQRLDTLKDHARFGPWVCRIAKYRAINLAKRYRDYIPFDEVENYLREPAEELSGYYDERLETEVLKSCVERLSEKIGTVIRLHYFEGLSISDIAKRMSLKEGTVKSRLSAGREQIRKELGYMDKNNPNETLVEAVMRRVEEFKEWRLKNSKKGFEEDYDDVMAKVESLPDSERKFFAMADVMQLGYWYLPDEKKTDEMKARLRETAERGDNKEVLAWCIVRDVDNYAGQEQADFVYGTAIPSLLEHGIPSWVAYLHYWLGVEYLDNKDWEGARREFARTLETGDGNDLYIALAKSTLTSMDELGEALTSGTEDYRWHSAAEEIIRRDGRLLFSQQPGFSRGWLNAQNHYMDKAYAPLYYASRSDNLILDENMKPGDSVTDSTGKVMLTCVSHEATVETPAGTFRNCVEMHTIGTPRPRNNPTKTFVAWYKRNIGLVAFGWRTEDGQVVGRTALSSFHIEGGLGYIPMAVGNAWQYEIEGMQNPYANRVEVTAVVEEKAYLSYCGYMKPTRFGKDTWRWNMLYARHNYIKYMAKDQGGVVDVSAYHARAAELAATPWERKMTEVSRRVMERIVEGEQPDTKRKGVWNFFEDFTVDTTDSRIILTYDRLFSFAAKDTADSAAWKALHNDIYGIITDNLGALWDPAWLTHADQDEPITFNSHAYGTDCEELVTTATVKTGVMVETRAGKFENCLNIRVQPTYEHGGWAYRTHTKDYYFAEGIGIVRVIIYGGGDPVYDLVAYEGTGEGYMPVRDGLTRRYEYVGDETRIHAGVVYDYFKNDNGDLHILTDRIGMMDV